MLIGELSKGKKQIWRNLTRAHKTLELDHASSSSSSCKHTVDNENSSFGATFGFIRYYGKMQFLK
jgi:hypothetical protein